MKYESNFWQLLFCLSSLMLAYLLVGCGKAKSVPKENTPPGTTANQTSNENGPASESGAVDFNLDPCASKLISNLAPGQTMEKPTFETYVADPLYRRIYGRVPNQEELNGSFDLMLEAPFGNTFDGVTDCPSLRRLLGDQPEAFLRVNDLFMQLLGRPATRNGYWQTLLKNGSSLTDVRRGICLSPEYLKGHGNVPCE